MRKFIAIIMILSIIVVQVDLKKKEAQAVLPFAIPAVTYIASAMVAAGAVGYFTRDEETGVWGGNLYEKAMATYETMSENMKSDLNTALAVGSFLAIGSIPSLWDFLHGEFTKPTSMVPTTITALDPTIVLDSTMQIQTEVYASALYVHLKNSSGSVMYTLAAPSRGGYNSSPWDNVQWPTAMSLSSGPSLDQQSLINLRNMVVPLLPNPHPGTDSQYNPILRVQFPYGTGTGTFPTDSILASPSLSISISADVPINPPADPTALSMATTSTVYLDRNGVSTTVIPSTAVQEETGQIDQDRAAAAASAAAAAIAAALANGFSQAAADAAGAAASAAIYAGLDALAAAAAGVAAATAYVTSTTGTLTTDIANTKPGDALDFSKLKFAATLFTNKFPFSLPWDLKNMLTTFGTGSTAAPKIEMLIGTVPATVDLAQFDNLAAAARVFELFIFNIALLFGTRKLLGGST